MTGRRDRRRPGLSTLARRVLVEEAGLAPGAAIVCAVSGGPDSTALLHVLSRLRGSLGFGLSACAVDHGLRADASREIALAEALAGELEVPYDREVVHVDPGGNLQARARAARHEALRRVAVRRDASCIATGHTADDRAETVLLRLLRGAGPRGLAVLPPRDGALIRPLIRARRADVEAHVAKHGLQVASDPSNLDPRFARVRVRRELLPLLLGLAPRIVESLCALADDLEPLRAAQDPLASLNRAQREAIVRALSLGRTTARVRIAEGRDLLATLGGGDDCRAAGPANNSPHPSLPRAVPIHMEEVSAPGGRLRRGGAGAGTVGRKPPGLPRND